MSSAAKNEKRKAQATAQRGGIGWFRGGTRKRILLGAIIVGVAIVGSMTLWRRVKSHVAEQPEYLVSVDDLEITPPPSWVHTDIKADVIRDAGLKKKISILDEHTPDRLSEAFALSPWVERVDGVHNSYPAHIRVELVYRRPVAMVEVPGGLLPVDVRSVVLPTEGFSTAEAHNYPRIAGVTSSPRGPVGTTWGDVVVERNAKLAAILSEEWESLGLRHLQIQPTVEVDGPNGAALQLVTRSGTVLVWGSAPGEEVEGEAKGADKLARLEKFVTDYQSLDSVPKNQRDLRRLAALP